MINAERRLSELMASRTEIAVSALALERDPPIASLTADSRKVRPGSLFAALPGSKVDGRAFIPQAIAAGASAILAPKGTSLPTGSERVALIEDANPRRRLALLAAAFYGRQPEKIAAVTGTNGKTSTAQFTRQIWEALGRKAGAMGTLGLVAPGFPASDSLTTPDPIELHRMLAEVAAAGVTHLAMEASSHGLEQFRLDGVVVQASAFTNLSRDHLDYHGTMEGYFRAKCALFERVTPQGAVAVLNADIPEFESLSALCRSRKQTVLSFGTDGRDVKVVAALPQPHGQRLSLDVMGRPVELDLPLVGRFQAWNALAALGLAIGCGEQPDAAIAALGRLSGVRGRLELVARRDNGATVYVDYAHTPDGLETVLKAIRPHTGGLLWTVFGAGGDRDPGKRPLMGAAVARLSDRAIVTDDNPRGEDPATIRAAVRAGCPDALEIGDRALAIRRAVAELGPGDVLVIAGKGHEQGQIVAGDVRPFDDATVARAAVLELDRPTGDARA